MADLDIYIRELRKLNATLSKGKREEKEKKITEYSDALAAALKKLKSETTLKKKKIEDSKAAAKEKIKNEKLAETKKTQQDKNDIEAAARVNAKKNELKGIYMGIRGNELEGDSLDYLEMAKSQQGREERELKETVYALEQKQAQKEKEAALQKKYADEAAALAEAKLIDDTKSKLQQLSVEIRAEAAKESEENRGLSDSEIKSLCNNIIKNATYKGTAYRSLVIREFMLMRDSGKFSDADIEKVKNMLYLTDEEIK